MRTPEEHSEQDNEYWEEEPPPAHFDMFADVKDGLLGGWFLRDIGVLFWCSLPEEQG